MYVHCGAMKVTELVYSQFPILGLSLFFLNYLDYGSLGLVQHLLVLLLLLFDFLGSGVASAPYSVFIMDGG